jgi:hypothetical protein
MYDKNSTSGPSCRLACKRKMTTVQATLGHSQMDTVYQMHDLHLHDVSACLAGPVVRGARFRHPAVD